METLTKFDINLFDTSSIAIATFIGKISVENVPEPGQIIFCKNQNWKVEKQAWVNGKLGFFVKPDTMGED